MKYLLLIGLLLFSVDSHASNTENLMLEFKIYTDFVINVFRVIGFILFGVSWYTLKKNVENPNQYPLSRVVWGMISGLLLQIAGILYSAFYNSFMGDAKELDNSFLALDISAINQMSGVAGNSSSILGSMIPTETMAMVLAVLYFIGVISFLKGIYLVKDIGQQNQMGEGRGAGGRAIVHMIAGFIAMHATYFGCAVEATFGFGLMCTTT